MNPTPTPPPSFSPPQSPWDFLTALRIKRELALAALRKAREDAKLARLRPWWMDAAQ